MPETPTPRARFCSQCAAPIVVADARFCKECGAPLPATIWLSPRMAWHPRTTVLLSAIPGLGHWYRGERMRGVRWFFAVMLFYIAFPAPLGILMHLICAANAGFGSSLDQSTLMARVGRRRPAPPAAVARILR